MVAFSWHYRHFGTRKSYYNYLVQLVALVLALVPTLNATFIFANSNF